MLNYSARKIIKKDVFKNGLANITERNVESEFFFNMYEIQEVVLKSIMVINEYEKQLIKRKRRLNTKLTKAAFDYK